MPKACSVGDELRVQNQREGILRIALQRLGDGCSCLLLFPTFLVQERQQTVAFGSAGIDRDATREDALRLRRSIQ